MPAFLAFLWGSIWVRVWSFAILILPTLVSAVLKLLGIGVVSYLGIDLVLSQAQQYVMANFDNLGTDLLAIMVLAKVDIGLKMVFAAMTTALTLKVAAGAKKLVAGKSGNFVA